MTTVHVPTACADVCVLTCAHADCLPVSVGETPAFVKPMTMCVCRL